MRNGSGLTGVSVAVLLVLAGCAVGPNYYRPERSVPAQFEGLESPRFTDGAGLAAFWRVFDDRTLDGLVADALRANHDLRIAVATLDEARALRGAARLDLGPTVTAGAGYSSELLAVSQAAGGPRDIRAYSGAFDASWELDFFGRTRRALEASTADLEADYAALQDAQVAVTAEVSRTYFELRGAQQQLAVARRNVDNQTQTLRLTEARLDAGRGTELDTSRATAQLAATRASIAPLEVAVARAIHRLGVLTGREPGALTARLALPADLPQVPQITAVGDPASLLRRRPDIRVSERQLAASTARIGVAVADLFPRVSFVGSIGLAAAHPGDLGEQGSGTRLIAPGLTWAAFDLGHVRARIAAARAHNDGALARYEQTVLRALEEAEDTLVAHARSQERLQALSEAAASSQTAARLARLRFENGAVDFLQVLDAERTLLSAEDQLAQGRTEAATSLVAVYKALGGGWRGVDSAAGHT